MERRGRAPIFDLRELNGALGDLGTLLPLALGCIAVAGLPALPILLGFALFYLATAFTYRLPIPVQPMKAVAALVMTAGLDPLAVALAGTILGLVLLFLALTRHIDRLARLVPQSVMAGLQLGLGLALALVAAELIMQSPLIGLATLSLLLVLVWRWRSIAVLAALAFAVGFGFIIDSSSGAVPTAGWVLPFDRATPDWALVGESLGQLVLPQLALTLTNAIFLTALLAGDYFGRDANHVTPRRLALTSGLGNLLLCPLGALPMCHGAGGLAAHHRFGARSGAAPLCLGLGLLALALAPGEAGAALLASLPMAALGALLLVAAAELAFSRRLLDCRPSCWPVIALTTAATLWLDPLLGLLAGTAAEAIRRLVIRRRPAENS